MKSNESNEFSIFLASNASSNLYQNKPSRFKVGLPVEIELDGEWEVALSEIVFPFSWVNVENEITLTDYIPITKDNERSEPFLSSFDNRASRLLFEKSALQKDGKFTVPIKRGYYSTIEELCHQVNDDLETAVGSKDIPRFTIGNDRRVQIHGCTGVLFVEPGTKFFEIFKLGVSASIRVDDDWEYHGYYLSSRQPPHGPVEEFTPPEMYIHCDLVVPQIMGSSLLPVIRQLPVTDTWNTIDTCD